MNPATDLFSCSWTSSCGIQRFFQMQPRFLISTGELKVIWVEIQGYLADLADHVVQDKVYDVDQKVHVALEEKDHQGK